MAALTLRIGSGASNQVITYPSSLSIRPSLSQTDHKEEHRLELQRLQGARSYNKIKDYYKLDAAESARNKFKRLVLQHYPHLSNLSPIELDQAIDQLMELITFPPE